MIPSGKPFTKNDGLNHNVSWEKSSFLWVYGHVHSSELLLGKLTSFLENNHACLMGKLTSFRLGHRNNSYVRHYHWLLGASIVGHRGELSTVLLHQFLHFCSFIVPVAALTFLTTDDSWMVVI